MQTTYPIQISPQARASDTQPGMTECFKLYITGRDFGNGFSLLNVAKDQAARFHIQVDAKALRHEQKNSP